MSEDIRIKREMVLEADAEMLEKMRKTGQREGLPSIATRRSGQEETIRPRLRSPISASRSLFDCLPQISRYGEMMKTKIDKARVFVKAKFRSEGSVLAETVKAESLGFETRLELQSGESP